MNAPRGKYSWDAGITNSRPYPQRWLQLVTLLERCSQQLRNLVRRCAEAQQLGERHLSILWLAATAPGGLSQVELAHQLNLSPAQLSQLLDHLRDRGLLESRRDPHDRRRQRTHLTAAGQRVWDQCQEELNAALQQRGQVLSPNQLENLTGALTQLLRAAPSAPSLSIVADPHNELPTATE